jgi:hypothetical protein
VGVADGVLPERADVAGPVAWADVRGVPDAEACAVTDAEAGAVTDAEACAVTDAEACAVTDAEACAADAEACAVTELPADELVVAERAAEDWPVAGDGVEVSGWVADPGDDVSGVGVKVAGTEEAPAVQAETATVSRAAPAASRPAVSHVSRVAAGVLSHIFMDPPRTRVRYTRFICRARPGDGELSLRSGCLPDKELPHNRASITGQAAKG